jgi:flagellar hook protein FlgE
MGIFDALNTSVAGLQAQSFALQNISGNIANAQTTGYKGVGTSFVDLVPDSTTPSRQVAGAVTAYARATISSQGTVSASTVATYMAINGDGFFSVQKATGVTDNVPVFTGVTNYTRRGDFQVNANGNLVNGAGYYLMGVTVDPKTGNPLGNVPQVLQFQNNFVPAQATSAIQYAANLPTTPTTPASSTAPAGTLTAAGGLNPSDFSQNPLPVGTPPTPFGDATVTGSAALNKAATPAPITAATTLSGASPSDSLTTNFAVGDTIVVDGTTLTFVNTGTAGNSIDITDTVGALLAKIGSITGVAPTINPTTGAITLHTGTAADLSITSTSPAFGALGFASPVTAARTGGGTAGTGFVIANDVGAFQKETISGGAVTAFNAAGTPVNLQLRWAKIDSASLGSPHQDSWNLFYQSNPNATGTQVGQYRYNVHVRPQRSFDESNGVCDHSPGCKRQRPVAWDHYDQCRLGRSDPICLDRRRGDHQQHNAERLCRGPASVRRHQQQRSGHRHLFQRAESRSCLGDAIALQRHQLPQEPRRRRLRGHRSIGTGDHRCLRHHQRLVA